METKEACVRVLSDVCLGGPGWEMRGSVGATQGRAQGVEELS